jgi:hypothetical protein
MMEDLRSVASFFQISLDEAVRFATDSELVLGMGASWRSSGLIVFRSGW